MDDLKKLKVAQLVWFLRKHDIPERALSSLEEQEVDGRALVSIHKDPNSTTTLKEIFLKIGTVTNVKDILGNLEKGEISCKEFLEDEKIGDEVVPPAVVPPPPPQYDSLSKDVQLSEEDVILKNSITVEFNGIIPALAWNWNSNCQVSLKFLIIDSDWIKSTVLDTERTNDGFMTCTNVIAFQIEELKKVNYNLIYKYRVNTSDGKSKEFEKYVLQSNSKLFSSQREAWRRFSIPKADVCVGKHFQKFDIVAFPNRQSEQNSSAFLKISPRSGRAQLKKQLAYAENETDSIMLSLKIHIGPMLEYSRMSESFASANGLGLFCNMIFEAYRGIIEQDYAKVELQHNSPPTYDLKMKKFTALTKEFSQNHFTKYISSTSNDIVKEKPRNRLLFGAAFTIIIKKLNILNYLTCDACSNVADMLVLCQEGNLECFSILEKAVATDKDLKQLLKDSVKELCKHLIKLGSHNWIRAVSVYHLLSDFSSEFYHDVNNITWTFWEELKYSKERLATEHSDAQSFSSLRAEYDDQLEHDLALHKVFLHLCPNDGVLWCTIQRTFPIIGISYVIENFKEKQEISDPEEQIHLQNLLNGLKMAVISYEEKTDLNKISNGLKFLSEYLIFALSSYQLCITVLKIVDLQLFVLTKCKFKADGFNLKVQGISEFFHSWIKHPNVIGGGCFGGNNSEKYKSEYDAWKMALKAGNEYPEISKLWKNLLFNHIRNRLSLVDNRQKFELIVNLLKLAHSGWQIMADVLIEVGIEGIQKGAIMPDINPDDDTQLANSSLRRILNHNFTEQVKLIDHQKFTFKNMLSWKHWPVCITLWTDDNLGGDCNNKLKAVAQAAHKFVHKMIDKTKFGDLTLEEFQSVLGNEDQMNKLVLSVSGDLNLEIYRNRLKKFEEHEKEVRLLLDLLPKTYEGYARLEMELQESVAYKAMAELCLDWKENGNVYVRCFSLNTESSMHEHLHSFALMADTYKSNIFRALWRRTTDRYKSLQNVGEVWETAFEKCVNIVSTFSDGTIEVSDLQDWIGSLDFEDVFRDMSQLIKGLMICGMLAPDIAKEEVLRNLCKKISYYQRAYQSCYIANCLLQLSDMFGCRTSCELLLKIAQTSEDISKYRLKDLLDNEFEVIGEALERFSPSTSKCLNVLIENWKVVIWIKACFTDVDQLGIFIDVALTASDDDLTTIKLVALKIVGYAVTGFIKELHVQHGKHDIATEDKSYCMIELCEMLQTALDQHNQLPDFLKQCASNLEWFNSIKDTQGNTNQTTLLELMNIRAHGRFIIGDKNGETFSDPSQAFHLILDQKIYNLSNLHDFESRLVLLAGQNEENTREVRYYLNAFHTVSIIAEFLCKLHASGCVNFIGWEYTFKMESGSFDALQNELKYLSNQLEFWEEAVRKSRDECYLLNSFTAKQILSLRKELKIVSQLEHAKMPSNFQCLNLLRNIFPCLSIEDIISITRSSEHHLVNPQNELIEEQPDVIVPTAAAAEVKYFTHKDIVEKCFSEVERKIYIGLTSTYGFDDNLLAVAEVIGSNVNSESTNADSLIESIGEKMIFNEEKLDEGSLTVIVNKYLKGIHVNACFDMDGEAQRAIDVPKPSSEPPDELPDETSDSKPNLVDRHVLPDLPKEDIVFGMLTADKKDYFSLSKLSSFLTNALPKYEVMKGPRGINGLGIEPGCPNMFVTSEENVLTTAVLVYANDSSKPLPTNEEVLLCTERTTAEEVILFWRRCIFDPNYKRVFCLVHGEKLTYSVCERSLKELFELKQGKSEYRLVVVCSNEGEVKSHLVTSLHNFRRVSSQLPEENVKIVNNYLQEHLISPNNINLGTAPSDLPRAHFIDQKKAYVRIIRSVQPGCGKSLYVKRLGEKLKRQKRVDKPIVSIPLHGPSLRLDWIMDQVTKQPISNKIIHLDLSNLRTSHLAMFLFSVLILGHFSDEEGRSWRREIGQMFCVEITMPILDSAARLSPLQQFVSLFPSVFCHEPNIKNSQTFVGNDNEVHVGLDLDNLNSDLYKLVYCYLKRFYTYGNLDEFKYRGIASGKKIDPKAFMEIILKKKQVKSWAEVNHFINFFNHQLLATEKSFFSHAFSGMTTFVITMMMKMSEEFSSSSVMGGTMKHSQSTSSVLKKYEIENSWNDSFHPYLFFNDDNDSMTFMGFFIKNCNAVNPVTNEVVIPNVIRETLFNELTSQRDVNLSDDYRNWKRHELLDKLSKVVGLFTKTVEDPDPSYVITADNVMKMMAILMRFRCGIPVVIMGETGCGKTRLLKYLCDIMFQGKGCSQENLIVLKVHGGTTEVDIVKAVEQAEERAKIQDPKILIKTVLFFDEANTTEHVGLIKEIMCDQRMFGKNISKDVRVVAAINPYRRHCERMIHRIKSAGLGFFSEDANVKEKLGSIPLHELVYRVNELPESMLPLIFDFGRLDASTERKYIGEIVKSRITNMSTVFESEHLDMYIDSIADILSSSQAFMRNTNSECSYVSLRDIERVMIVFNFFMINFELFNELMKIEASKAKLKLIKCKVTKCLLLAISVSYNARLESRKQYQEMLVKKFKSPLAELKKSESFEHEIWCCQLGVLNSMKLGGTTARNAALCENVFMMLVCISLRIPLFLVGKPGSSKSFAKSIILNSMKGQKSHNDLLRRLKEIQLFPYQCSQYSTSATIVDVFRQANVVQNQHDDKSKFVSVVVLEEVGLAEDSPDLPLKVLHPLLEDGTQGNNYSIETIDREKRVAFIGISNWALDPAKMNRGIMVTRCDPKEEELELTAREICTQEDTLKRQRTKTDNINVTTWLNPYFSLFAKAYLEIIELSKEQQHKNFFGLRDFYSLVKMLCWMCKRSGEPPTWRQIEHCVRRNFGGFNVNAVEVFGRYIHTRTEPQSKDHYREIWNKKLRKEYLNDPAIKARYFDRFQEVHCELFKNKADRDNLCKKKFNECYVAENLDNEELNKELEDDLAIFSKRKFDTEIWPLIINPPCDCSGLIKASLANTERSLHGESRYLLFLTENYSALQTLTHFLEMPMSGRGRSPYIIFGSSFPKDKDYTQVCHNINSIKLCMQTGRPVILLNLDHLYESLYDALNQHYVYFGDLRFIDLGLQNHRFKCTVHDDFKLILIAEKEKVYNQFPTPLINRLEKHFVVTSTILTDQQMKLQTELTNWIKEFVVSSQQFSFKASDSFVGYHDDTPSAIIFKATQLAGANLPHNKEWREKVLEKSKQLLLRTATPDALIRSLRSPYLQDEYDSIVKMYQQQHQSSLAEFLSFHLVHQTVPTGCRMQVTTYSELLSEDEILATMENVKDFKVTSCVLEEFDTEFAFSTKVREAFQEMPSLLIIQCHSGHLKSDLIACAKYRVDNICEEFFNQDHSKSSSPVLCHVLLVVLIPREQSSSSFVGFLGGDWICAHIDELFPEHHQMISQLLSSPKTTLNSLFYDGQQITSSTLKQQQIPKNGEMESHCRKNVNYYQFLHRLIQSAIHRACSFNSDSQKLLGDVLQLNKILNKLLTVDPPNLFFKILVQHIWEYIQQKEDCELKDWLMKASINRSKLAEGGGFQQLVLRELDELIISAFSRIILTVSQAGNIQLLNTEFNFMTTFWNFAFSCPAVCTFDYNAFDDKKLQNPIIQTPEIAYECQFPFSWLIMNNVSKILSSHLAFDSTHDTASLIEQMTSTLMSTSIDNDLLNTIEKKDFEAMQNGYIADIIHLYWGNTTINDTIVKSERSKLLAIALRMYIQEITFNGNNLESFSAFVCKAHYGIDRLKDTVELFDRIIEVLPKLLPEICSALSAAKNSSMSRKTMLIEHACSMALKELDSENRVDEKRLVSKLHLFYKLNHVLNKAIDETEVLKNESWKWLRIQTTYLFIEYVIMKFPQYLNTLVPFSNMIQKFMQSVKTKVDYLEKIEKILNLTLRKFSEVHERDTDQYIEHCTSFYMEVITKLTIGETEAEDILIAKLLNNVFTVDSKSGEKFGTRDLTPFLNLKSKTDSAPVLRSFLLQLLIKKKAQNHIKKYFNEAADRIVSGQEGQTDMMQLKLLYCKLFEESYNETVLPNSNLAQQSVAFLTGALKVYNQHSHESDNQSLQYLQWVGTVRFILYYFTALTRSKFFPANRAQLDDSFHDAYTQLSSVVKEICRIESQTGEIQHGPHELLIKLMYRTFGEVVLKELHQQQSDMAWILPESLLSHESKDDNLWVDSFVIYGEQYFYFKRELLAGKSLTNIRMTDGKSAVLLGLYIFSEITQAFSQPTTETQRVPTQELSTFVQECPINEELKTCIMSILTNAFCGQDPYIDDLYIKPRQSHENKILSSIVLHMAIVLISKSNEGLLKLFKLLLTSPSQLKDCYLPTMPDVNQMQIDKEGSYYFCDFGHNNSMKLLHSTHEVQDCLECAKLGRRVKVQVQHRQVSQASNISNCQTGYILGIPTTPSLSDRHLTKASYLIIQALLHSMFIWASCNNQKQLGEICSVVKMSVEQQSLPSFFWKHFVTNIHDLETVLSLTFDDTALLLHLVVKEILESPIVPFELQLSTQAERNNWEELFDTNYIQPVTKNSFQSLENARICIAKMHTKQKLLNLVMESDTSAFDFQHSLWKYHPQITLEMIHQTLRMSKKDTIHSSLDYFLKEEPSIRATKFLPAISKLQQYLYRVYNCRCSRAETRAITIGSFIKDFNDEIKEKEFTCLLQSTNEAWSLVKGKLQNYGKYNILEEHIAISFDMDTPLSYFIPNMTDEGQCTLALVEYLVYVHNKCIYQCETTITYIRIAGDTWKSVWKDRAVQLEDLQKTDLILYEDRLKAVILAHCHYSLVAGQGSAEIEFDFAAMERHILDDFVYTKPKIIKKSAPHTVSFREDVYEKQIFQNIREKVYPQIDLRATMKKELVNRLAIIQKLRLALDHINIVIGFLSAGGKELPQTSLVFYATKRLAITDFNKYVFSGYNLEHTIALWRVISLELAKKRTINDLGQSPFDVKICFQKQITSKQKVDELNENLRKVNVETILGELSNFIETHVRNASEKEAELMINDFIKDPHHFDNPSEDIQRFSGGCLKDLELSHIVNVWVTVVKYQEKIGSSSS